MGRLCGTVIRADDDVLATTADGIVAIHAACAENSKTPLEGNWRPTEAENPVDVGCGQRPGSNDRPM